MGELVILGIDPGTRISGYSILKQDSHGKAFLLDFGYVKLDSVCLSVKPHLSKRVGDFYDFFNEKIKTHGVTHIALETPFLGKNAQTFLKLGYLRGILYLFVHQYKLKLSEFSPTEVKMSVVGFGGATKDQVALMVKRLFPKLEEVKKIAKDDVTDALAVSVCGLWHTRNVMNMYSQTKKG